MTTAIAITCLLNRQWNVAQKAHTGQWVNGELIHMGTESDRDGKLCTVGVVVLQDRSLQAVPLEFIKKI
ncbi:MAG: hypothetical protein RR461_04990 [Angelakisella sp.]